MLLLWQHVCLRVDAHVYLQGVEDDEDVGHDNWERDQDATQPGQSKNRQQHQHCFHCSPVLTHRND